MRQGNEVLNIKPSQNIKQMFHCVFWTNALFFLPPNTTVYSYILQPLSEQQFSSRRPPTNSWLLPSYLIIGEEMCKKIGHKTIRCKYFAPWSNQSDRLKVPACVEAALYQHWQSINYGLIISQSRPVAPWVELQTKVCDDFTITEKAPTGTFSRLKVPTSTFSFKTFKTFKTLR